MKTPHRTSYTPRYFAIPASTSELEMTLSAAHPGMTFRRFDSLILPQRTVNDVVAGKRIALYAGDHTCVPDIDRLYRDLTGAYLPCILKGANPTMLGGVLLRQLAVVQLGAVTTAVARECGLDGDNPLLGALRYTRNGRPTPRQFLSVCFWNAFLPTSELHAQSVQRARQAIQQASRR
jgi:hypothetical protein